jgi:uncharacterized damage-inducible protein DinB
MTAGITFVELLDWIGMETTAYERWFAGRSDVVWAVPVGLDRTATVRDLLFHFYMVDLRYGQRLRQLPVSSYADAATADAAGLFALARRGQDLLRSALDGSVDLTQVLEFQTISAGTLRASGRKILAHSLTHHIRHLAQIATALRQHGHATDWMHDLLMSDVLA